MELCVNDKFTTDPSPDDIGRTMDSGPHPEGWYLVLDDEADDSDIEATARADGAYDLTAGDGRIEGHSARPLTADQVKAILLTYRARERGWRDAFTWTSEAEEEEEARPAASRSSPPDPANPINAALKKPKGMYWLLLVVVMALFALAAHQAGIFS